MKIVLIQIDLVMGARVLMSLLLQKGYTVKALQINIRYTDLFSEEDLGIIYEYVGDCDVVGMSFNSFYFQAAKQLAIFLKEKGIKYIVTGGNHVTALPEEGLLFSDIVVKYEAEITLPKILEALENEGSLSHVKGIVYKQNGLIIDNKSPDIVWELDALPFQSIDTNLIKYFNFERKLYTPKKNELFPHGKNTYFILASRGCPFNCTYCSNSLYHKLDKRFKIPRKRSIGNIIEEMAIATSNGFESFMIVDDHFFSFTYEEIRLFNAQYKKIIKKPFSIVGINPNNFRSDLAENKLKLLIDCGLTDIRIGVQSGSDKTLKIFKRNYKAREIPKLLELLDKYKNTIWDSPYDKLNVALDFICDAPWEKEEDKVASIKLALRIMRQYTIFFYTLVYLPGTKIYYVALKNGWIKDSVVDIYLKGIAGVEDNIYNRILFLIAVLKERSIDVPHNLINNILRLSHSNKRMAEEIIDSTISCVNGVEEYHKVNLRHAALHPYLNGFHKWTKTKGEVGKKVLFRSYHKPYG